MKRATQSLRASGHGSWVWCLGILALSLLACTTAAAQDAEPSFIANLTGISDAHTTAAMKIFFAWKIIGELYAAVRNGGGLRQILLTWWFGQNVPPPIAKDYHAELNPPKNP